MGMLPVQETAMSDGETRRLESRLLVLLAIVVIGSLWGLLEATVGSLTGRLLPLVLLPILAGLLRLYAGLLLGLPIMSGAVANAIYAFFVEAAVFVVVIFLIEQRRLRLRSALGGGLTGATIAVLACILFLPVGLFTGIPACPLPGTSIPLCIWGMPVAAVAAAVSLPAGLWAGAWLRRRLSSAGRRRGPVIAAGGLAFTAACVLAVTLANAS